MIICLIIVIDTSHQSFKQERHKYEILGTILSKSTGIGYASHGSINYEYEKLQYKVSRLIYNNQKNVDNFRLTLSLIKKVIPFDMSIKHSLFPLNSNLQVKLQLISNHASKLVANNWFLFSCYKIQGAIKNTMETSFVQNLAVRSESVKLS